MNPKNNNFNSTLPFMCISYDNFDSFLPFSVGDYSRQVGFYKSGNKIHIKKANRGKFTEYCGGNVTSECILRGKHSSNPKIRKRATFAENARKWKHYNGGSLQTLSNRLTDFRYLFKER